MLQVNHKLWIVFVMLLAIGLPAGFVIAQEVGERVVKRGSIDDDIYLAGGEVELDATVNGDVVAGGGELFLDGVIQGDLIAAGGSLTVRSQVADDARLAGGEVQLFGAVGDDVIAAAGRLRLNRDSRVGGRAWLSGGDIRVESTIVQELRASGGRINITGEVQGDVYLLAQHISIGPEAVITGNLHTKGPREAIIADGARIDGDVQHTPAAIDTASWVAGLAGVALLFLLSLMVTGVVLYLVFPRLAERTTQSLRLAPWPSLGIGLAVFAATPIVILALFMTVVGVWLALLLLAAYLILLLLGYLTGAFFIGETGLGLIGKNASSRVWRALALAVAILVLAIVGMIPFLGALLGWLLLLAGMGAIMRQMYIVYQAAGTD